MYDVKTVGGLLKDDALIKSAATVVYRNNRSGNAFKRSEYYVDTQVIRTELNRNLGYIISAGDYFAELSAKLNVPALDLIKTFFRSRVVRDGFKTVSLYLYKTVLELTSVDEVDAAATDLFGENWFDAHMGRSKLSDADIRVAIEKIVIKYFGEKTWEAIGCLFKNVYAGVGVPEVTAEDYCDLYDVLLGLKVRKTMTLPGVDGCLREDEDWALLMFRNILERRYKRGVNLLGLDYDEYNPEVYCMYIIKQPELREYYSHVLGNYEREPIVGEFITLITELLMGRLHRSFFAGMSMFDTYCPVISKSGFYYTFRRADADASDYYHYAGTDDSKADKWYKSVTHALGDVVPFWHTGFNQNAYCMDYNLPVCFYDGYLYERLRKSLLYEWLLSRDFYERYALFDDCTDADYGYYCKNSILYIGSCYLTPVLRAARNFGFETHLVFDLYPEMVVDSDEDAEYVRECAKEAGIKVVEMSLEDAKFAYYEDSVVLVKLTGDPVPEYAFEDLQSSDDFSMNALEDDLYRFTLYSYFCKQSYNRGNDAMHGSLNYNAFDAVGMPLDHVYDIDKSLGGVHRKIIHVKDNHALKQYVSIVDGLYIKGLPTRNNLDDLMDSIGFYWFKCGMSYNENYMSAMCVGVRIYANQMKPIRWAEFAGFDIDSELYAKVDGLSFDEVRNAVLILLASH